MRKKRIAIGAIAIVLVGAAVLYFSLADDEVTWNDPVVRARSDSPDGKYRCVVIERSPRQPNYSPYLYTITLRYTQTGSDLSGQAFTDDNDSVAYREINFRWSDNLVEVSEGPEMNVNQIAAGKFAGDVQQWSAK
jgi:hypothetical protein